MTFSVLLFEKEQCFTLTIRVKDDRVLLYRLGVTDCRGRGLDGTKNGLSVVVHFVE